MVANSVPPCTQWCDFMIGGNSIWFFGYIFMKDKVVISIDE